MTARSSGLAVCYFAAKCTGRVSPKPKVDSQRTCPHEDVQILMIHRLPSVFPVIDDEPVTVGDLPP